MSLLDKAKQSAKKADDEKKQKVEREIAAKNYDKESLATLTKLVLESVKELNNAKTNKGTLKLVKKRTTTDKTIANLRLVNRPDKGEDIDLLYIDAAIESGTRSWGEGCENEPYTEAAVTVYVKQPPTSERYSYAPTRNWAVASVGLSSHFSEYITMWNKDDLPKKLEKVAEWLAPLFQET